MEYYPGFEIVMSQFQSLKTLHLFTGIELIIKLIQFNMKLQ